jgi:hypothetical protein
MRSSFRQQVARALIVAGLTVTTLVAMPAAALAAGPSDPFIGSYRAIDTSFDDSSMLLAVGGPDQPPNSPPGPEGIRRVIWLDDFAAIHGAMDRLATHRTMARRRLTRWPARQIRGRPSPFAGKPTPDRKRPLWAGTRVV